MKQMVFGKVLTQMTANAGIRLFGEEAVQALMQESAQLEDSGVLLAKSVNKLTREQKGEALRDINLITKKRDGRIKGHTVADGSVQNDLYEKISNSLSHCLNWFPINLSNWQCTWTKVFADVVAAYLKADMNDYTLLEFTRESVDIKMNPKYEEYVITDSGRKVLYVQLLKSLYGCVASAILWYELLSGHLKEMWFEINP